MVTAALLVSGIGVVAPITVRCGRLWQQTRYRQLALDELTNHMERLVELPIDEIAKEADEFEVSEAARTLLPDVVMDAKIVRNDNDAQLHLSINWKRVGNPDPLRLVAWLNRENDQ
ncbi:hypothetical protein, membrane or secreted [Rhodopirellula maiorica SM1]|uniref:Uncharacterized protein n=2 Tax=Novipirellula TaxID=2795426 RepID=M5RRI2_9BACT|nr:hypothetical protein, membrane or secreted [Rhodopirellula maiorica SM1]